MNLGHLIVTALVAILLAPFAVLTAFFLVEVLGGLPRSFVRRTAKRRQRPQSSSFRRMTKQWSSARRFSR